VRAYTILATWPEKSGAKIENNENGGRKEALGVWAWKLESLQPGEKKIIAYSLSGLERGDWTETEVLFRGSQDVIGATKMDEKFLQEIRRQEQIMDESDIDSPDTEPESEAVAEPETVLIRNSVYTSTEKSNQCAMLQVLVQLNNYSEHCTSSNSSRKCWMLENLQL
jgi:hypothetical protein